VPKLNRFNGNQIEADKLSSLSTKERVFYNGIVYDLNSIKYIGLGYLHRVDGPAVVYWNNNENFYYIHGKHITKNKHDFLYSVYLESKKDFFNIIKYEKLYSYLNWESLYED